MENIEESVSDGFNRDCTRDSLLVFRIRGKED